MKAMARNNPGVQQRLFDRFDLLLDIVGAEDNMADALIEVPAYMILYVMGASDFVLVRMSNSLRQYQIRIRLSQQLSPARSER